MHPPASEWPPMNSTTIVRPASAADIPWIRHLAVESAIYGVPEGRDRPNEEVRQCVLEGLKDLGAVLESEHLAVLVAEAAERPLGYLVLRFGMIEPSTGDPQTYLVDMAVEKGAWGSNAAGALVRHAARLTAERGFRFMTAMVTAGNRRALLKAQRLGFEIERHALVMACGSEGPLPMPGRPEQEKGYGLSRRGPREGSGRGNEVF